MVEGKEPGRRAVMLLPVALLLAACGTRADIRGPSGRILVDTRGSGGRFRGDDDDNDDDDDDDDDDD